MLHYLIEWTLIRLHIIEGKKPKDAIKTLAELLPIIFATTIILGAVKYLGLEFHYTWYQRLWHKIKYSLRRARAVLVGY